MIITFNFLFRILTILLFLIWQFYWIVAEQVANKEKPKKESKGILGLYRSLRRRILTVVEVILILQLIGLQIFPLFNPSFTVQLLGFTLVIIGIGISITARRTLGVNWVAAPEYQIKTKQELITTGIYGYIRHPIYLGICLSITGGELVAQSYLFFIGIILLLEGSRQARLEEKLLVSHFGEVYKTYMKRTKMFIPYLW